MVLMYLELRDQKIIQGGNIHYYPDFLDLSPEFRKCYHSGQQDTGLGTIAWCFWPQPPDGSPFYEMFLCCFLKKNESFRFNFNQHETHLFL